MVLPDHEELALLPFGDQEVGARAFELAVLDAQGVARFGEGGGEGGVGGGEGGCGGNGKRDER